MWFFKRSVLALFFVSLPGFAGSAVQGIQNFYQLDDNVYRGAQPSDDGYRYLAKIGVKTVLDLQEADHRAAEEQRAVTALGLRYINVPMTGLIPPTEAEISKILTLLEDATAGPVFVHCHRGADRTGAVLAAYRIDHYRWDNARALKEAESDGMSMFQLPRKNYIRHFQPLSVEAKAAAEPREANALVPAAAIPVAAIAAAAPAQ